jgi:hypothetical protein
MTLRSLPAALGIALCATALGGCGTSSTTVGFKGTEHTAAEAIANLASAASAGEGSKICDDYLTRATVAALGGHKGCEKAIKDQLAEVDNLEVTITSVKLGADGHSATAQVRSIYAGKTKARAVALLEEGGSWKVSGP